MTGKTLVVRTGKSHLNTENDRLWVECVIASEEDAQAFIELDTSVRTALSSSLPESASRLLQSDTEQLTEWLPVDEFVRTAS